ncbi:MAG: phage Gp37/Gp68 family protein [Butyrivibrio sp.]|nr:phage Gp37/Gp68 family protein [Acetatifactor muris]MCM1561465.1 phage Gp37/Gp68 family protein [Butyrivibrio sp.]
MNKTKIDWCDSTWNPVTGCLHGCEYCYARGIAHRFSGGGENWTDDKTIVLNEKAYEEEQEKAIPYPYGFIPTFHRYRLNDYICKKGRNIFVCSMADLFGHWIPLEWQREVFTACRKAPQHNYIFLTKNPQMYVVLDKLGEMPADDNMWFGATVTTPVQSRITGKKSATCSCQWSRCYLISELEVTKL